MRKIIDKLRRTAAPGTADLNQPEDDAGEFLDEIDAAIAEADSDIEDAEAERMERYGLCADCDQEYPTPHKHDCSIAVSTPGWPVEGKAVTS